MLAYLVQHFFAGLWAMIWHFGAGIGIVILLAAAAYFVPSDKAKIAFAVLASFVVAFLLGETMGIRMEKAHYAAQAASTAKYVGKIIKGTATPKARGAGDPWDRKGY